MSKLLHVALVGAAATALAAPALAAPSDVSRPTDRGRINPWKSGARPNPMKSAAAPNPWKSWSVPNPWRSLGGERLLPWASSDRIGY